MVISFATCIAGFVADYMYAAMENKLQVFCYMLGAGIMSISTGVKFYRTGKPKSQKDYDFEKEIWNEKLVGLENTMVDHVEGRLLGLVIDLLSVFIKNILDGLCNLFEIPTNGNLDKFCDTILKEVKTTYVDRNLKKYYKDVFVPLEYISYARGLPSYSRDLKLFSLITIVIGALQIIIGIIAFKSYLEE